jgi:hypothetical protein
MNLVMIGTIFIGKKKIIFSFFKTDLFFADFYFLYSINIGPVHVLSFSTEFYYYVEYGFKQIVNQYHWIEKDLIEANKPENRAKQPCTKQPFF